MMFVEKLVDFSVGCFVFPSEKPVVESGVVSKPRSGFGNWILLITRDSRKRERRGLMERRWGWVGRHRDGQRG